MGLFRSAAVVAASAVIIYWLPILLTPKLPINIGGTVASKYKKVEQVFRSNFVNGVERAGAALAVYEDGKLVVDLWGGYADPAAARPWKNDTMSIAVGALAIAHLVDKGHLKYSDLITKHWPAFGKHGKGNATVAMIMEHTLGVVAIDVDNLLLDIDTMLGQQDRIAKAYEDQKPQWPVGTDVGYHGFTYGDLVNQIVRRSDPLKRTIGQYVREELSPTHGENEFYLGLPEELTTKVARCESASAMEYINLLFRQPFMIPVMFQFIFSRDSLMQKMSSNPKISDGPFLYYNNPDYYKLEHCGFMGIGTARGLAKMLVPVSLRKAAPSNVLDELLTTAKYQTRIDRVMGAPFPRNYGFMMNKHPQDDQKWLFGHPGYGGQQLKVDLKNKLVIAYVTNHLQATMGDGCFTYASLQNAIYESLGQPYKAI